MRHTRFYDVNPLQRFSFGKYEPREFVKVSEERAIAKDGSVHVFADKARVYMVDTIITLKKGYSKRVIK